VLTAGQALAFDCNVANKPVGAGSAVTLDVSGRVPTVLSANKPNPGTLDHVHGGFATITANGTVVGDTFAHAPTKAQAPFAEPNVNPGASLQTLKGRGCDGKGLDTFESCGHM
jgi:hypothetical protein